MTSPLLSVRDLRVSFGNAGERVRVVDGVSFDLKRGETLAVVGESGSGKSVTAMTVMGLIESQRGRVEGGRVCFDGVDLASLREDQRRGLRGRRMAMIFQEPMSSLNPVYSLGFQIAEPLRLHLGLSASEAKREAVRLLTMVGIPAPERRVDEYPHQLSGGMRQRAMIAMALSCGPELLIADEPTTALDVTVQAQILELLASLQEQLGTAILLITHDLGVVAQVAHRAVVMYAGRVMEQATVEHLFERPRHPYTAGLFESLPKLEGARSELRPIEGNVPDAAHFPPGCRFHPRCRFRHERCEREAPPLVPETGDPAESSSTDMSLAAPNLAACWHTQGHPERSVFSTQAKSGDETGDGRDGD